MVVAGMKHILPGIVGRDNEVKPSLNLDSPLSSHTREILHQM